MKWLFLFCGFFIFFISVFSSCDLSMFANNRSRQYSIVSPEDEISQIPTSDFFFINLKSAYYTGAQGSFNPLDFMLYAMDDGPGTQCKISVDEESSTEDLYCMLDVMEGDLWYHEIELEYNVPPGMCSYLGFLPHWHFNYEVGYGPPYVAQERTSRVDDNNNTVLTYVGCDRKPEPDAGNSSCSHSACTTQAHCEDASHICNSSCSHSACTTQAHCEDASHICNNFCSHSACTTQAHCEDASHACNNGNGAGTWTATAGTWTATAGTWTEVQTISICKGTKIGSAETEAEIKEICPYFKKSGDKDINCCLGGYTLFKDGKAGKRESWGDDEDKIGEDCIGGVARIGKLEGFSNQTLFDKNSGLPVMLVRESGREGVQDKYTLPPLISHLGRGQGYSFPLANFFKAIEDDKENPTLPDFYIAIYTGHPFITWSCLDNAKEVKHRIHLLIREWNTQEEFNRFKESQGSRGDPDTEGREGSGCDYYESTQAVFGACNDLDDADDFENRDLYLCSNRNCTNKTNCEDEDHSCNGGLGGTAGTWEKQKYPEIKYE